MLSQGAKAESKLFKALSIESTKIGYNASKI